MESQNNIVQGFFTIDSKEDGIYVTVHSPIGNGKKVEVQDVLTRLTFKQVKNVDRGAVELAVSQASQRPVKVAEPQQILITDATISIAVSPDKMKAFLKITPPDGGRMFTYEEIMEKVQKNRIVEGIKEDLIQMLASNPTYNEDIVIAEGIPPINGENGTVELLFETSHIGKPKVMEDGSINYKELNLVENVIKGQELAVASPPGKGTPGMNVEGGEIPAREGKAAVLPRGKNVEKSEDGLSLVAGMDGYVSYIDEKVSIFNLFEVKKDVGMETGNINFVGNVSVFGNVLSGFSIEATGSVEIAGTVEGAYIKAGGDIIIRRGMEGFGKGALISDGDIIVRFVENARLEAKGDIKAEAIMHSMVKCGRNLELSGKKGLLVGGNIKVGREISAKVIGSHLDTVTEIEVGTDPVLREKYAKLRQDIPSTENEIKKADQIIEILSRLEKAGAITPEKKEMLEKSQRTKVYYENLIEEMKEEYIQIEEKLKEDANGKVKALDVIHSGTKVSIGTCSMYVKDALENCTLYRDGADVRIGPYI
jgi:uncharacterized protein (DUF342 family)